MCTILEKHTSQIKLFLNKKNKTSRSIVKDSFFHIVYVLFFKKVTALNTAFLLSIYFSSPLNFLHCPSCPSSITFHATYVSRTRFSFSSCIYLTLPPFPSNSLSLSLSRKVLFNLDEWYVKKKRFAGGKKLKTRADIELFSSK